MDRLDAMTAFVTVAELRGFAPAARRLGLSPSAVTRLVARLEARLSIRLLQRTTRSVALTDAGVRFLARARSILGEVAEAEAAARAHKTTPAGRLVVTAPLVFGRREVAPLLCAFLTRYPAVAGELTLADRVVNLIDEGVDVAVRIGHLDDSSLTVRKVGETRRVLVAAPSYLARHRRIRGPEDLVDLAHVHVTGLQPSREWRFVRRRRELRVPLRPSFTTNSVDAAIGHAELGGGLAMVLAYQVVDAVAAGRLQVVLPTFETPPLPIQVVYPSARLLSAAVRGFVDVIVACGSWRFLELSGPTRHAAG